MSNLSGGNRGGGKRKKADASIADKFKGACPPHRLRDLETLVRAMKGDEEKIIATLSEWWDEPETVEPEWEDVNKKSSKRGHAHRQYGGGGGYRGDRGGSGSGSGRSGSFRNGGGGGRGFNGRGMGGGRGAGAERRSRDHGDKGSKSSGRPRSSSSEKKPENGNDHLPGVPAPVTSVPRPKGAWGQSQSQQAPPPTSSVTAPEKVEEVKIEEENISDVGMVRAEDPTPAGFIEKSIKPKVNASEQVVQAQTASLTSNECLVPQQHVITPQVVPPVQTSTNVWKLKGSAHLIEAEKPKPLPQRQPQPVTQRSYEGKTRRDRGSHRPPRGKQQQLQSQPQQSSAPLQQVQSSVQSRSHPQHQHDEGESMKASPAAPLAPDPILLETTELPSDLGLLSSISSSPPAADDDLLPASVNGANINATGWQPRTETVAPSINCKPPPASPPLSQQQEITEVSPLVGPITTTAVPENGTNASEQSNSVVEDEVKSNILVEDSSVSSSSAVIKPPSSVGPVAPDSSEPVPSSKPPIASTHTETVSSILNLGRWDVSEVDDTESLDFGFGSFGHENDISSVDEVVATKISNIPPIVESTASTAPSKSQIQLQHHQPSTTSRSSHTAGDISTPASNTVSPARPPPGLSISGMPPMPANAVLVHELEGKIESVTLAAAAAAAQQQADDTVVTVNEATTNAAPTPATSNVVESSLSDKKSVTNDLAVTAQSSHHQPPNVVSTSYPDTVNPIVPQAGGMSQYYTTASGMGMYNYNGAAAGGNVSSGYVGIHTPTGHVLAGGVLPQQQKLQQQSNASGQQQQQQASSGQSGAPQHHNHSHQQQVNLYGAPSATTANVGIASTDTAATTSTDAGASAAGLPPGMPGAMPYNHALFYGQQHYQMGQPPAGVGYGYGYAGQFGGAVQGGFGYQQVMNQNGAYGQPYDDTPQQHHGNHSSHHSSSSHQGGYQKNSHGGGGGYRGRSSHHSSHHSSHGSGAHQYQNQYNPQHGAYGGQPYSMAYNIDHFNQRAGYGPGSMDPYTMQQTSAGYQSGVGHSSGGFSSQDDNEQQLQHNKGKTKSGSSRGSNSGFGGNPNMQQFQQQVPPQQQAQAQQQQPFGFQSDSSSGAGASNAGWSNQSWVAPSWQGN